MKILITESAGVIWPTIIRHIFKQIEHSAANAHSITSVSKSFSDRLIKTRGRLFVFSIVLTNYSSNYLSCKSSKNLTLLTMINAFKGESIFYYGNSDQLRDFSYVDTHSEALRVVIKNTLIGKSIKFNSLDNIFKYLTCRSVEFFESEIRKTVKWYQKIFVGLRQYQVDITKNSFSIRAEN